MALWLPDLRRANDQSGSGCAAESHVAGHSLVCAFARAAEGLDRVYGYHYTWPWPGSAYRHLSVCDHAGSGGISLCLAEAGCRVLRKTDISWRGMHLDHDAPRLLFPRDYGFQAGKWR